MRQPGREAGFTAGLSRCSTHPMPTDIIAELSGNHHGALSGALALVEAAAEAGATTIKVQCFDPQTMTLDVDDSRFKVQGGIWDGRRLADIYREQHTPWDWIPHLFDKARYLGLKVGSSVFCQPSADFIADLNPDFIKIASLEIVDTPLIEHVARKGLPMVISTGMAVDLEIDAACTAAREAAQVGVTLLFTPEGYPAEFVDLTKIARMKQKWIGSEIGFSDHTLSETLPAAAISHGATMIEKHLTLSRAGGLDASFSMTPSEFARMVIHCREIEGVTTKGANWRPEEAMRRLRRSLYIIRDVKVGTLLDGTNVASIRPAGGLPSRYLWQVRGKRAKRNMTKGTPLSFDDYE